MKAYDFHPVAEGDINAIWDYIAENNPEAERQEQPVSVRRSNRRKTAEIIRSSDAEMCQVV